MSSSSSNGSKLTAMKMYLAMEDIVRICDSVNSSYIAGKRLLSEAHSILYSDTKKAYKLTMKAKDKIIAESKAASEYNRCRDVIPQISDKEVMALDAKYKAALEKEDYKSARDIAIKISKCDKVAGSGHSLRLRLEGHDKGGLSYIIDNGSNQDLVVRRFNVFHDGVELASNTVYPFVIRHSSPQRVRFSIDDPTGPFSASLEYTEDGIVKVLSLETNIGSGE